jgi:pSer/pThr/pTyr-binding forkhead associated (FHA) protein
MAPDRPEELVAATVTLHLLDTSVGRSVQVWRINSQPMISIGRAEDCDVTIADPYVSRRHAELERRDGRWWIVSRGRNGVQVDGRKVDQAALADGQTFRLGDTGPVLRFLDSSAVQENSATLYHEAEKLALFHVDPSKLQQEVRQITESDYFQNLQQKAGKMRGKENS